MKLGFIITRSVGIMIAIGVSGGCSGWGLVGGVQLDGVQLVAQDVPLPHCDNAMGHFAIPTLGGTQLWTDVHFFHDWRIQQHHESLECRLLDGKSWQHAKGSFQDCLAKLTEIQQQQDLPPMSGKAVVILHGLAAPRWSMHRLGSHLKEAAGFKIFNVEYASTRQTIDEHAADLARVMDSLDGIEQINLVGHSMGNIVIRRYLAGQPQADGAVGAWIPDRRIHRIVMIAPPNHGSTTARRWSDRRLFRKLFGPAGRQLGSEWAELEQRLATPSVEFGIIAGGLDNSSGFTFRLRGDDDGRITVATTHLAGAADFVTVPMIHELIANDSRAIECTRQFLEHGFFIAPDQRQPIRQDLASADEAGSRS